MIQNGFCWIFFLTKINNYRSPLDPPPITLVQQKAVITTSRQTDRDCISVRRSTPCFSSSSCWAYDQSTASAPVIIHFTTTTILQPSYWTTCVSRNSQRRTGGFCRSKVLLLARPCWWQLAQMWVRQKMLEFSSVVLPALSPYCNRSVYTTQLIQYTTSVHLNVRPSYCTQITRWSIPSN